MMTPRERWMALLNGEKPDRIPTDYWATPEVTERLQKDLGCPDREALYDRLHIDGVNGIGPLATACRRAGDAGADAWGVRFRRVHYGNGCYDEAIHHPLAEMTTVEEIHAYPWPDPDAFDWAEFAHRVRTVAPRRIVRAGSYEPFLRYCYLRGMELAMMDLLVEPEIAEAILGHIFDYHYRMNERIFDIGHGTVDLTYVAEDLGSQTGLLMGMETIRRFILPNQKRMADLARSHGIHIFYHTDGAAREAIPDLIASTGIEILNPIQWRCPGMEREGLVRDFGRRVIFHGAVDNQVTLPFGSADDVRNEVLDNIRIFGGVRWICAPCHNLQPVSPTANIVALYQTIHEYGSPQGT